MLMWCLNQPCVGAKLVVSSLLFLSIWPTFLARELLSEPVVLMGLEVSHWLVNVPVTEVQAALPQKTCLPLPQVQEHVWQCLTKEVLYSWDYSAQPSLWSESRQVKVAGQAAQNNLSAGQHISWQGADIYVTFRQEPLFLLHHQVQQEAYRQADQVYLAQQYQGAFVYAWYVGQTEHLVSAWRHEEGYTLFLRLERKH